MCDVETRKLGRTYSPETVGLMSAAFDRVYQSVSSRLMNEHEDLKQSLAKLFPQVSPLISNLLVAIGTDYADDNTIIAQGAVVSCFPPVSGG